MLNNRIQILKWWLDVGFYLLPVQHEKKYLVAGWGIYQRKVENVESARDVFLAKMPKCNVAVMAREKRLILDFDDIAVYTQWVKNHPEISKTYTEKTPNDGTHVFLRCDVPSGLHLIAGVENKKVCVVFPSIADGKPYQRGEGEILEADAEHVFDGLTIAGTRTAFAAKRYVMPESTRVGLIEQIKSHWSCEQVLQMYHPEIEQKAGPKVVSCRCPFHDDKKPSFYILPEIGVWGCHACNIRGDVINLYARFEGIDNREAISRMSRSLAVRS